MYVYICLPFFVGTELNNQKARAEFINENLRIFLAFWLLSSVLVK